LLQPEALKSFGKSAVIEEISPVYKHILTHQRLYVRFITIKTSNVKLEPNWFFADVENIEKFALPKIIFIFIKNIFNL